jgi:RimJ/RimL family protein N-acetyltransferase
VSASARSIRPVSPSDRELLFRWANDADVRRNSFHPEPIPWEDHVRWFARKLSSTDTAIWILEVDGVPAGQVRYERSGADIAEVGISIAAEHRGRGHAADLLRRSAALACDRLGLRAIEAFVLIGNDASRRAFLRAGYRETGELTHLDQRARRFEHTCPPRPE